MSYSLINQPTANNYTPAATLECPSAKVIALTVSNAAVRYQLGLGFGPPNYESDEHFAVPGVWILPRADAIRCRSAAAGVPAQVSVSAY